jgi:UDP-N-acetyl-D-galactosamine dehydrogenase
MIEKDHKIKGAKVLIMGITFKENCPDVRNTRVVDIYHELKQYGLDVTVYDPWADPQEVEQEYGMQIITNLNGQEVYDGIVIAVAHREFLEFNFKKHTRNNAVIFDTKACIDRDLVDGRL